MRLTICGATGGTGLLLVDQAIAAGHQVTAVVRDPSRLPEYPNLRVVAADVLQPASLVPAIGGADAVLSAIGSRTGRQPTTICHDSAVSIVAAMHQAAVSRLLVVSASGPFTDSGDDFVTRYLAKPILNRILKHTMQDFREMETVVRASGLDWTIVRPPQLLDTPGTGRYRTSWDVNIRGGIRVPRADLAHCLLKLVADPTSYGSAVFVAS